MTYSTKWGPSNYCNDWTGQSECTRTVLCLKWLYTNNIITDEERVEFQARLNKAINDELDKNDIHENPDFSFLEDGNDNLDGTEFETNTSPNVSEDENDRT